MGGGGKLPSSHTTIHAGPYMRSNIQVINQNLHTNDRVSPSFQNQASTFSFQKDYFMVIIIVFPYSNRGNLPLHTQNILIG